MVGVLPLSAPLVLMTLIGCGAPVVVEAMLEADMSTRGGGSEVLGTTGDWIALVTSVAVAT